MKEKIAFVVQRYGLEVNGGSEMYCRQVAEKLTAFYDVTVYTTCAVDYSDWANKYQPGVEEINGVHVRRFRVRAERKQKEFDRICQKVLQDPRHSDELEQEWIEKQGPDCPDLIDAVKAECGEYRAVLFMTYLYYTTAMGLLQGIPNAILIPTAHDEPWAYLRWYDRVFENAAGLIWLTPEEREFARKRFPFLKRNNREVMTGIGIEKPAAELPELPESLRGQTFLTYAGRIDENKGCREMFDFYRTWKRRKGEGLKLVLMGKPVMEIPKDPDIISLGFVSEEMKYAVMREALALVLCSRFESLSIVVLESMMMGRPVLVSAHSEVLKGHCVRSNAGLYFRNYPEFEGTVNYLMTHPKQYEVMRENGKRYVAENYQWDVIIGKYRSLIETF